MPYDAEMSDFGIDDSAEENIWSEEAMSDYDFRKYEEEEI